MVGCARPLARGFATSMPARPRRSLLRRAAALLALTLGVGIGWVWNAGSQIIGGYAAKMICSCVFVAERSLQECLDEDVAAYVPYIDPRLDATARFVRVRALSLRTTTARVDGFGGCTLE